jgi:cytochrome c553
MRLLPLSSVLVLAVLLQGCEAAPPSRVEIGIMTKAKHSLFIGNKSVRNPIAFTESSFTDGKDAFTHYCVACHGMDAQKTGVPFADRMNPPVPSLASKEVQSYTDGQLKWVIDKGISRSGMPGAKELLSDDEQWSIVVFLRHLPPAGSLGEPSMYSK